MLLVSPETTPSTGGPPARLAVLASGSGSNFEAICSASLAGDLPAQVVGLVYNNPGAFVAERAARLGVEAVLVDHRDFGSRDAFDAAVVGALQTFEPDWIAMAGWMRIATSTLLEAFPDRIVNIHPSLLPSFRGLHAVEQAFAAGVRITGCTVHVVRAVVDDGPIIAQAAVPVFADDSLESLTERIHAAEHLLYPRALALAIAAARR